MCYRNLHYIQSIFYNDNYQQGDTRAIQLGKHIAVAYKFQFCKDIRFIVDKRTNIYLKNGAEFMKSEKQSFLFAVEMRQIM